MKIGTLLLARMGSTRLPGKVMLDLHGKPVLEHIINRLQKVTLSSKLVVATTTNPKDDLIENFCKSKGFLVFRGSENNVLDRCIKACDAYSLDCIVRVGADTPFIDWKVIDSMLDLFLSTYSAENKIEYLSNSLQRSYPLGLDADIMTRNSLLRIDHETKNFSKEERKKNEINVIPYIHENLDKFNTISFHQNFDYSNLRWTLDTTQDFELTQKIYNYLFPFKPDFLMNDILEVLEKNKEWSLINSNVIPRSGYWTKVEKNKLRKKLDINL
ncbi:spore coat protein [Candidatus Magnetomorum sp. HK-1]|nr:spore coat protein [Candidatus Magnetomorum sp. HK-1]